MKQLLHIVFVLFISIQLQAQQKKITGNVTALSDGLPLPGVNVVIKGSTTGTQTDFDGNYTIMANVGDKLIFNFIGMKSTEVIVGSTNVIDVILEEDSAMLEEVVVVAYGINKNYYKNSGPTASQIKRQKQKAYHNKISNQLQGKVVGVNVKGVTAISANKQPLYIVDGIPVETHYNEVIKLSLIHI